MPHTDLLCSYLPPATSTRLLLFALIAVSTNLLPSIGTGSHDASAISDESPSWSSVDSFLYQLQNVDLAAIGETHFDLVVIDYSADGGEDTKFTFSEINSLKNSPGGKKLVLAYMSIGEAEDYRWYWQETWDANHDGAPDNGAPSWLGPSNPDWPGNYKVQYWQPDWKSIVFEYVDKVIDAGFDGIYLDIIDAFEYWGPDGESGLGSETAEQEMVDFVKEIAEYARERSGNEGFGVFPQNGEALSLHADYVEAVTGIGREDVWYVDNTPSPDSDIDYAIENLDRFKEAGKVVLVIDYVTEDGLIKDFYSKAAERGYIPYATVRELDELIERYPQSYQDAVSMTNLMITDSEGSAINTMPAGEEAFFKVAIRNNDSKDNQPFLLIMEVRDRDGITASLQFREGTLMPNGSLEVVIPWAPEENGDYDIRSFTISGLKDPRILTPILKTSLMVSE